MNNTNPLYPNIKIKEYLSKISVEKQNLFNQIDKQKKFYQHNLIINPIKKNWNMIYTVYRKELYPIAFQTEVKMYKFACKGLQNKENYNEPCAFYYGNVTYKELSETKGINKIIYYTDKKNFKIYHSAECCGMYCHSLDDSIYNKYDDSFCICFRNPNVLCIMNNGQVLESGYEDYVIVVALDPKTQKLSVIKCFTE